MSARSLSSRVTLLYAVSLLLLGCATPLPETESDGDSADLPARRTFNLQPETTAESQLDEITVSVSPITELYTEAEIQLGTAAGLWFSPMDVWADPSRLPIGMWNGRELLVIIGNSGSWTPQFELRSGNQIIAPASDAESIRIDDQTTLTLVEIGDVPSEATADLMLYEIRVGNLANTGMSGGTVVSVDRGGEDDPQQIVNWENITAWRD